MSRDSNAGLPDINSNPINISDHGTESSQNEDEINEDLQSFKESNKQNKLQESYSLRSDKISGDLDVNMPNNAEMPIEIEI